MVVCYNLAGIRSIYIPLFPFGEEYVPGVLRRQPSYICRDYSETEEGEDNNESVMAHLDRTFIYYIRAARLATHGQER